ncbi:MAG: AAA family ATPase, partial [Lachnoclostridium sp.]|nr:AAA family ATPase [Lachnoclostridium sp.]
MRVPYAMQDFREIREENMLYVDKTKYIETLEEMDRYVLFLRPRRFGKTLFTSVLEYYYDIRFEADFDKLFGGLYIGSHKTKKANSYHVLKFNFSGMNTEKSRIKKSFADCVRVSLQEFVGVHRLNIEINETSHESNTILRKFLVDYKVITDSKIYLIIDEYDHFANDVLSDDREYFDYITGRVGFVRNFYEVFKVFAGNTIERIFITGVTPITLDSLTSGFNLSKNLGNRNELNGMMGFTEEEVVYLLKKCNIDNDYVRILREYYNGYLFAKNAKNKVYNSNLLMYFLSEFMYSNELPENLVDTNVISDNTKLTKLFDLYEDSLKKGEIIEDIVSGNELT